MNRTKKLLERFSGILSILSGIFAGGIILLVVWLITAFKLVIKGISLKAGGEMNMHANSFVYYFFGLLFIFALALIVVGIIMLKKTKIINGKPKKNLALKIIFFSISAVFMVLVLFTEFSYIYILFFMLLLSVSLEIISICLKEKKIEKIEPIDNSTL